MQSRILSCALIIVNIGVTLAQNAADKSMLYFNQEPPGTTPRIFAPETISKKDGREYGSVFSKNGEEFYYAVVENGKAQIRFTRLEGSKWTEPVTLIGNDRFEYNDPFLSPDEKKLFFISDQAMDGDGDKKDIDIWYADRKGKGWSEPVNAGREINTDKNEYYISFTKNGTMYFASNGATGESDSKNFDIYSSEFSNGKFQPKRKMDDAINTVHYEADVFIDPDERFIIFCSERPGGYGRGDLFISFKGDDGAWQQAKNMGSVINTQSYEFCPFVSRDGKYLFYTSNMDIYWVDAGVIEALR
jgi:Tol biopolymer transport system component